MTRRSFIPSSGWMENTLDTAAATRPDPGRVSLHRLNRKEYANAVWDILRINVDPNTIPATTVATASTMSQVFCRSRRPPDQPSRRTRHRRRCRSADSGPPVGTQYIVKNPSTQFFHVDGMPLGTRGGLLVQRARRRGVQLNIGRPRHRALGHQPGVQEHPRRDARRQEVLAGRYRWRGGPEGHRPEAGPGGRRHQCAPQGHPLQSHRRPAQGGGDFPAPDVCRVGRPALPAASRRRPGPDSPSRQLRGEGTLQPHRYQ